MSKGETQPGRRLRSAWSLVVCLLLVFFAVALAEKTCPSCGTVNRDDAKFCKKCGAKLPEAEARPGLPGLRVDVNVSGSSVSIASTPSGALVIIDDVEQGRTPLTVDNLSPGRHTLELRYSGYRTYYGSFTITARVATLVITSDPVGAEIWVDGIYKGKTTETGLTVTKVPFGQRSILARFPGYEDATKLVEVQNAGPIGVLIKMGKGKGFLSVTTKPSGAEVLANGRKIGTSDLILGLAPDRYMLSITKPGYVDWLGYAEVRLGETTYVRETLARLPRRQVPLLVAGATFLLGGVGAGLMAERSYGLYQAAENKENAVNYRRETQKWDMIRNVGFGAGVLGIGAYFVVKW